MNAARPAAGDVISTTAQVEALTMDAVVLDPDSTAWQRTSRLAAEPWHNSLGGSASDAQLAQRGPLRVVHSPGAAADADLNAAQEAANRLAAMTDLTEGSWSTGYRNGYRDGFTAGSSWTQSRHAHRTGGDR